MKCLNWLVAGMAMWGAACPAAQAGSGCAEWFSQASWMFAHEIATQSTPEPEHAARMQVMYATWHHLAQSSLDPLHAGFQDMWVGGQSGEREGYPKGAAACEALARRKIQSGEWSSEEIGRASQRAVDELALIDWNLANKEVERMRRYRDWRMQSTR